MMALFGRDDVRSAPVWLTFSYVSRSSLAYGDGRRGRTEDSGYWVPRRAAVVAVFCCAQWLGGGKVKVPVHVAVAAAESARRSLPVLLLLAGVRCVESTGALFGGIICSSWLFVCCCCFAFLTLNL